ncbi:MAG: TraB/GumN family protein [Leptospiraceae bacterium]|nr:TraB/GumN family protein [Leptospiraceae bacterium]
MATKKKSVEYSGPLVSEKLGKCDIKILGTAHISAESVEDVKRLIHEFKPDIVAVELCASRYKSMTEPDAWKKLDIVQVIKNRKIYLLMSSVLLSIFQRKMGKETGVKPGQELLTAINEAGERNIHIELIDRDVQTTLRRAWQKLGFFKRNTVISELIAGLFINEKADEIKIEELKKSDALESLLENLPPRYNSLRNVILSERDAYMSGKLQAIAESRSKKTKIAAIVGAAHVPGIQKEIQNSHNLEELEKTRKVPAWQSALKILLPIILIMGVMAYYTDLTSWDKIRTNLLTWVIFKSGVSGLGAILARTHILAILASILVAPISNFNPVLKPGWLAALIQAHFRKPRVEDFENLVDDVESWRTALKNRVIKVFLALMLPQLGSSLGTALALWYIARAAG